MNVPKLRFDGFSENWNNNKLGELFVLTSGTTPSRTNELFFKNGTNSWIKTLDLNNGVISNTQEKVTDLALEKTSLKLLPIGTVLIAMYGGFNQIGRTGLLSIRAGVNQALTALLPNENIAPFFLLSYLNYHVEDWKTVAASSRKDPNITKNEVANFIFIYPSFQEQTKIANFLTAVDDKISQLSEKCDLLTQYKKGVMQQIFSQELRFKDDAGQDFPEWEYLLANRIFANKTDKNHSGELPILAAMQDRGMIFREDSGLDIKSTDASVRSYKIVDNGDFVISLRSFQGGIEYSTLRGICSPAYTVLTPKIAIVDGFYRAYLKKEDFIERLSGTVIGIRDGKQISYSAFSGLFLPYPSIKEQTKIANVLSAIDAQINDAQAALGLTRAFKKGLLQQMFV